MSNLRETLELTGQLSNTLQTYAYTFLYVISFQSSRVFLTFFKKKGAREFH